MSRLFVLVLPMILLWVAFRVGVNVESSEKLGVSATLRNSQSEKSESQFSATKFKKEAYLKPQGLLERLRGEEREESKRAPIGERTEDLVELVLSEISPDLLEQLTSSERELLRSYISNRVSPAAQEQPWLCWGPDVAKEKAVAFYEAERLTSLLGSDYALFANQFLSSGTWNRTAVNGFTGATQGLPITVTWSIVPDGTSTPGVNGQGNSSSDFRSWMASIYGGSVSGPAEAEVWFEVFQDAFEAMAETCGITLLYEPNDDGVTISTFNDGLTGTRGDIRISARSIDGNSGTLAFAFSPNHGDIVFDSNDSTFNNISSSSIRLFNTIAHELGHSLGLAHVCPLNGTKLLEPILTANFRGPRFDEFQSLQRLYGDALEISDTARNNDSSSDATFVDLVEDVDRRIERLSIDDNTDLDYFEIQGLEGQKLSLFVRPGEGTYREGEETSSGCSLGTDFDSTSIHDLTLEILAPDGVTVLALSDDGEEGEVEHIDQFELEDDGSYFVRIDGDTSNAAQLYRIDFRLGDRDPAARLRDGESSVLAESGSVKNARLDPNETVKVAIEIQNSGILPTGNLSATVTGSSNVSVFSSEVSPVIAGSEMGTIEVVYGALGECGEVATLSFEISDESGLLLVFEREFLLGDILNPLAFDEDFDDSTNLPDDWETVETGSGVSWSSSSSRFASPIRAAHAAGVASVSEALFISPAFELASGGGTLSFDHLYRIETGFDGAVLEASRNEGAWFDLIESPSVTVTGGYDRTIRSGFDSAIAGQLAWSAVRTSFMTTTVELPIEWAGESLRFRWRLVHDRSTFDDGWWIDNVKMEMLISDCEVHRPVLNLELTSGVLNENEPSENAIFTLSSELPLVESVSAVLESGGTANDDDFEGDLAVTLPAGVQSVSFPLSVVSDDISEGEELLVLTIPDDQLGFAAGENFSQSVTITDLSTVNEWMMQFFGGMVPLTGDSDGDGFSELAEYLLGTDPTLSSSKKIFELSRSGNGFVIPLGDLPERADATLGLELSDDLVDWIPGVFEKEEVGLIINSTSDREFLRLTFSLDQ